MTRKYRPAFSVGLVLIVVTLEFFHYKHEAHKVDRGDHAGTEEEERERVKEIFLKFDLDGGGCVARESNLVHEPCSDDRTSQVLVSLP